MPSDEEYLNMMIALPKKGTIRIESPPKEIIDVDQEIIFNMKARLKDESFSELYGIEDQRIDELALYREREKVRQVFTSPEHVFEVYSSIKLIRETKREFLYTHLDYELLTKYANLKTKGQMVDEADLFAFFLGKPSVLTKKERIEGFSFKAFKAMEDVMPHYLSCQLDFFGLSKEVIETSNRLVLGFKRRKLSGTYDRFLQAFYGRGR